MMGSRVQNLPVIPPERGDDLHNLWCLERADLVLFMAGNQFMVMDELVRAFRREHPAIGNIFYETLPPGLELKQIIAGGAVFRDREIRVTPDIYTSVSAAAMDRLEHEGLIEQDAARVYLHNRLVLMVRRGNPAGITTVRDLARDDVRVSQPDPEMEDIGGHILNMYEQAGGPALVRRIMQEKKLAGTTRLTTVHHRETPERIIGNTADVGPVWATEAVYALRAGLAVDRVDPGPGLDQRQRIKYYICMLRRASHPENGRLFLDFMATEQAQAIYAGHGFIPAPV